MLLFLPFMYVPGHVCTMSRCGIHVTVLLSSFQNCIYYMVLYDSDKHSDSESGPGCIFMPVVRLAGPWQRLAPGPQQLVVARALAALRCPGSESAMDVNLKAARRFAELERPGRAARLSLPVRLYGRGRGRKHSYDD
jgi:hypothetical protein